MRLSREYCWCAIYRSEQEVVAEVPTFREQARLAGLVAEEELRLPYSQLRDAAKERA